MVPVAGTDDQRSSGSCGHATASNPNHRELTRLGLSFGPRLRCRAFIGWRSAFGRYPRTWPPGLGLLSDEELDGRIVELVGKAGGPASLEQPAVARGKSREHEGLWSHCSFNLS